MRILALLLLPIAIGCNTVNDSVLNKEEMKALKALPDGALLKDLSESEQAKAKKYIIKVIESVVLLEEEYYKNNCLLSDNYGKCVQESRELLQSAKKGLAKDDRFAKTFSERVPLHVVYTADLNRNSLLSVSSFKSEIKEGLSKEERLDIKKKVEHKQQQEQDALAEKLGLKKDQAAKFLGDLGEILKGLSNQQ
jgi:hypothetical protein